MSFSKLLEQAKAAGWKREDEDGDEDSGFMCEDGTREDLWQIQDWLADNTKELVQVEGAGDDYSIDDVVIGVDPHEMEDGETLKHFKKRVVAALKDIGVKAALADLDFTAGGSDASGMSWIGSCG